MRPSNRLSVLSVLAPLAGTVFVQLGETAALAQQKPQAVTAETANLERIVPSADGCHFVGAQSGAQFVVWGVNCDHDASGRLLEDYWGKTIDEYAAAKGGIADALIKRWLEHFRAKSEEMVGHSVSGKR